MGRSSAQKSTKFDAPHRKSVGCTKKASTVILSFIVTSIHERGQNSRKPLESTLNYMLLYVSDSIRRIV